jgi:hypothetical protein
MAIVWDDVGECPKEIMYGTTRGWTYLNSADVDATDEVRAKYSALLEFNREKRRQEIEEEGANRPKVGRYVRVFKGRKVPVGTEGFVFWSGSNQWGESVGIETADGKRVFTSVKNVQVLAHAAPARHRIIHKAQ